jgi:hypothetical protein
MCFIEDGDAHVAVGDQVEFSNSRLGRLRIRHIPGPDNERGPWNAGESVKVRSAILVERRDPRDDKQDTRRFVPVGRFNVDVAGQPGHQRFDFLTSTATEQLEGNNYPRGNVELGDDEILVRGGEDDARHGGVIHLRSGARGTSSRRGLTGAVDPIERAVRASNRATGLTRLVRRPVLANRQRPVGSCERARRRGARARRPWLCAAHADPHERY